MSSDLINKKRPNKLLRVLIIISIGIHFIVFAKVSALYDSSILSFIELEMRDFDKPEPRTIPRPRIRPRQKEPQKIIKLTPIKKLVPVQPIKPLSIDKRVIDNSNDRIEIPVIPSIPGANIAGYNLDDIYGVSEYDTMESYLQAIRQRIERNKKYPERARKRRIQGRVAVRFKINPDGSVECATVIKGSRYDTLDRAAIRAVESSSPFPLPPRPHHRGVTLEVAIMFELT